MKHSPIDSDSAVPLAAQAGAPRWFPLVLMLSAAAYGIVGLAVGLLVL